MDLGMRRSPVHRALAAVAISTIACRSSSSIDDASGVSSAATEADSFVCRAARPTTEVVDELLATITLGENQITYASTRAGTIRYTRPSAPFDPADPVLIGDSLVFLAGPGSSAPVTHGFALAEDSLKAHQDCGSVFIQEYGIVLTPKSLGDPSGLGTILVPQMSNSDQLEFFCKKPAGGPPPDPSTICPSARPHLIDYPVLPPVSAGAPRVGDTAEYEVAAAARPIRVTKKITDFVAASAMYHVIETWFVDPTKPEVSDRWIWLGALQWNPAFVDIYTRHCAVGSTSSIGEKPVRICVGLDQATLFSPDVPFGLVRYHSGQSLMDLKSFTRGP
jgi:hypothetical protein